MILVTPRMTSNTAPAPYVASCSTYYSVGYAAWIAFDGSTAAGNCWATQGYVTTGWLQIQLPIQTIVVRYGITDASRDVGEDPHAFTLQGSNNGTTWTVLDTRQGQTWDIAEEKQYAVQLPGAYVYYRLDVTANNGSGAELTVGEFCLYAEKEADAPGIPTPTLKKRFLGTEDPTTFGPTVNIGSDQYLVSNGPWIATLTGSSPDSVTYLWTKVWGPGTATFTDDTDPTTDVEFSVVGIYRLRLTVDDGSATAYRDVTITASNPATNRVSQVVVETVSKRNAATVVSQVVAETVVVPAAPAARVSQVVVETATYFRYLGPPFLAAASVLFAPALDQCRLYPPTIASGSAVYAPSVSPDQEIGGATIPSGTVLYSPTVSAGQSVTTPFISSGAVLYPPTVEVVEGQPVTTPFIDSGAVLYPPTVERAPPAEDLRVSQVAVDSVGTAESDVLASQTIVESLGTIAVDAWVSQVTVEVLSPVTPPPPEVEFPSDVLGLLIWIEWTHIDETGDTTYVYAKVSLADAMSYYGGWKEARVVAWGKFRRALSDRLGQYEIASLSWTLSDTDRFIRGMLAHPTMRYFQNRQVAMRMIDDAGRRREDTPRLVARGVIRNCKPVSPLLVEFTAEDFLSSTFSAMNFAKQIPQRTITTADFPSCAKERVGLPVPIIYGNLTDALSTSSAMVGPGGDLWWVVDPSIGSHFFGPYPDYFAGYGHGHSVGVTSAAAVPADVVVEVNGPGSGSVSSEVPNYQYGFMVVAIDADGYYSDPNPYFWNRGDDARGAFYSGPYATVPIADLGSGNDDHSITVSWTASANAVAYRVYMAYYYYGARPVQALETAGTSVTFTTGPSWTAMSGAVTPNQVEIIGVWYQYTVTAIMGSDGETTPIRETWAGHFPYRRIIRLEWTEVPGATGYRVWRHTMFSTVYTRWLVADDVTYFEDDLLRTDGEEITELPVSTGVVPPIHVGSTDIAGQSWVTLLVAGHACKSIDEWFVDGVKVPADTAGTTWLIPGLAGWPYANTYVDLNGHRYTLIFTRGPDADLIAAGTKRVTINLKGIESEADGSGTLISNLHDQYLHACQNWLFQSYQAGAWLASPMWAEDVNGDIMPQIDEVSFSDVKTIVAASRLVTGYVGAWAAGIDGSQNTLRDVLAMLNLNADVNSGFSRNSQFFVSMLDPDTDLTDPVIDHFRQATDVVAESFDVEDLVDELYNSLPIAYRQHYVNGTWMSETTITDADSITNYRETRSDALLELWCVRDEVTARSIATSRINRTKDAPRMVRFLTNLRGLNVELGDVITIDHIEGIGTTGWEGWPLRVIRHEFDPEKLSVWLECTDVNRELRQRTTGATIASATVMTTPTVTQP